MTQPMWLGSFYTHAYTYILASLDETVMHYKNYCPYCGLFVLMI